MRRRLRYVVPLTESTVQEDVCIFGKHKGKAVPVPTTTALMWRANATDRLVASLSCNRGVNWSSPAAAPRAAMTE